MIELDIEAVNLGATFYTTPWENDTFYFKYENNLWYYLYKKQWFIADQKTYVEKFNKGQMKEIKLC